MLSTQQKEFWQENGYLHFEGFYRSDEINRIHQLYDDAWRIKSSFVVVDDLETGQRCLSSSVGMNKQQQHHFKVNDLYLIFQGVRNFVLKEAIVETLFELLGDQPVLCNTLNLEYGSQQADHMDSLYMTPRTMGKVAATWVALEQVHSDSGPLRYYPGSHRISPYVFSTGSVHFVEAEMPLWERYMTDEIKRLDLRPQLLLAGAGDLFLWHASLLHGGSAIRNPRKTRKSLVSHFWTVADCRAQNLECVAQGKGFWYRRPPQPVPGGKVPVIPPSSLDSRWSRWLRFLRR